MNLELGILVFCLTLYAGGIWLDLRTYNRLLKRIASLEEWASTATPILAVAMMNSIVEEVQKAEGAAQSETKH